MQNIVTLGEINDALKIAAVTAAQLAEMGFAALANKPICEGLPPEESRRLRNAKLYPAESIGQIRVALAQRLAAPAATTTPDERKDLVPGVMRCAKCEFQLVRQVLAVNLGEVFAGDSKTEPCPNDCGPLWPVTWKQYAEQAMDAAESMADRAFAAEKEVKQLRGELSALDAPSLRAKVMSTPLGLYGTGIGDIGIAYRAGHRAALLTAADLVASTVVAAPAAVAVPAQALTGDARTEAINRLAPIRAKLAAAAVAVPDERAAFEIWWSTPHLWSHGHKEAQWAAWQARAALAATPAAVQTHAEAAAALCINSALTRIRAGNHAESIAPLEHALRALAATPAAAAPDMVSVNKEDANNYCRILTALGMEEDSDPVAEVQSLLAAAAAPVAQTEVTWCEYIAGMIGCYLKEPDESPRVKAIAGIIERRLWALPSPKPVARTDKPASFEAWAKSEGGPFALHNCGPYNRDAMKLAGMAWHASALLATATGLPAQAVAYIDSEVLTSFLSSSNYRPADGWDCHIRHQENKRDTDVPLYSRPQAQADARDAEITWPKARDIGRIGDMSQVAHIRVGFDSDNDVFVSVWDENGGGSIEFCNPGGGGGGQSSRTRMALIALMVAMEADNVEKPSRDWWAQRAAIATAKGEQQS